MPLSDGWSTFYIVLESRYILSNCFLLLQRWIASRCKYVLSMYNSTEKPVIQKARVGVLYELYDDTTFCSRKLFFFFAVTRPDWAYRVLRDSSLFTLPYDCRWLSESSSILVPLRLWDRLRDSSGTNTTQRKVCAYPLSLQDVTSPWPVVSHPDLTQHSEFPVPSFL